MPRPLLLPALFAAALPMRAAAQTDPPPTTDAPTSGASTDAPTTDAPTTDPLADELADAIAADTAATPPPAPPARGAPPSLNPDITVVADVALAWFSAESELEGGHHDPAHNGFTVTSLELALGKAVDPYFRFDANLVFGEEGLELEEAYATTLALPHSLQARAGQFLTRFGRHNATHPHAWDFADQPFALTRVFGGEGNRNPGVELSWLTPLPWFVELMASATDARGGERARSFIGDAERDVDGPGDLQYTAGLESFHELSPDLSLLWGASYATGPGGARAGDRAHVAGIDAYLKYRPITAQSYTVVALTTEWLARRREVPVELAPGAVATATLTDVSGYAQLAWRFARRWGAAARYEHGSPARDADGALADPLDPTWSDTRSRGAAALTFWPTEFSRLRAQLSVDQQPWLDEPIVAGFLTFQVVVGAHGAHAF